LLIAAPLLQSNMARAIERATMTMRMKTKD
jgi:hypothetical protein